MSSMNSSLPTGVPMRMWLRSAVLVVTATATAMGAASDTQERQLRRAMSDAASGMSALGKGNVKKARELFEQSLAAVPDYPEGHLGLGHIAMQEKRFEDALKEFQAAEAGYTSMSAVAAQMASARYSRSRDELQSLRAELSKLDSQTMQNKAPQAGTTARDASESQVERDRTQLQSRIRTLEAMNPPSSTGKPEAPAEVFFFEGNALFDLKRTQEAIAMWEKARERNAKLPLVENNLAVAYWTTGRLDDARTAMERAEALGFKVNPNFRADLEKALAARP
jgi:tetratricopeptide (TPR) repeat protein